jgi:hypothetical protein
MGLKLSHSCIKKSIGFCTQAAQNVRQWVGQKFAGGLMRDTLVLAGCFVEGTSEVVAESSSDVVS